MLRLVPLRALVAAALTLALAAPALAQDLPLPGDGFTWEEVGDQPINVFDLAFGRDSTLWATASGGDPYRLDLSAGFPGAWVRLSDSGLLGAILPLGHGPQGDTLLANTGGSTLRSTDGCATWAGVHDEGDLGLYEVPQGYPFAGRLLTGDLTAIGYSVDRGATFTASAVPGAPGHEGGAHDLVALPPGSSDPGRILAAGRWGVNVSDDGGATFRESALWGVLVQVGEAIGVVGREGAGGDVVAVMAGRRVGQAGARVWSSADGGETWAPEGGQALPEGPPSGPYLRAAVAVLPLGGESALVVLGRGTVYRSDDAGQTWEAVGRAPEVNEHRYVGAAAVGPDGRLYVGVRSQFSDDGWVWRTGERVTVGAEPGPGPGDVLRVEVSPNPFRGGATVTLTLGVPFEVRVVVYDGLGRRVALLHEGALPAGAHGLSLDGSALPAGLYLVRVEAGGVVVSRRVTLLR